MRDKKIRKRGEKGQMDARILSKIFDLDDDIESTCKIYEKNSKKEKKLDEKIICTRFRKTVENNIFLKLN